MKNLLVMFIVVILSSLFTVTTFGEQVKEINVPSVAIPEDISIIRLIANPDRYDGKIVRIIGYVRLEFEGNAIYLSEDDYKHGISKNGIWLDVTEDILKKWGHEYKGFCLIEGRFNSSNNGHMGLFSGTIENITRFEKWDFNY